MRGEDGAEANLPWALVVPILSRSCWESLFKPAKPREPTFLRNPPIFSDRFTFRRRLSDAVMRRMCHFSTTAYFVPSVGLTSPTLKPIPIR
jgi:hypothetical protein